MLLEQVRCRSRVALVGAAAMLLAIAIQPVRAQDALQPGGVKQVRVGVLSPSVRHVIFDRTAFFGQTTALPRWDKNYLVSLEVLTYQGGVPNVRLYNRDGQKVREAAIWFPDSQRVILRAAAATSNGGILAGEARKKPMAQRHPSLPLPTHRAKSPA